MKGAGNMRPTAEEIAKDLIRLSSRISAYGDDPISDAEKHSLAKATAYCVEMVRMKYNLINSYYGQAERVAEIMYDQRYNGLKFH